MNVLGSRTAADTLLTSIDMTKTRKNAEAGAIGLQLFSLLAKAKDIL